jgi:phosphotransferase system  glucose/maltose/N-acetylglucosamine-specific IIC component
MKEKSKSHLLLSSTLVFCTTFLTSCSEVGLMSNKNRYLPHDIDGLGEFFQVFIVLQISMLFVALLLSFFIGGAGGYISGILHFIWIVSYRDYGFLTVLFLFGLLQLVLMFLLPLISGLFGRK